MGIVYDFLHSIIKETLGLPMSSNDYERNFGSRNIFSNYKDDKRYHHIGYPCFCAFKSVVNNKIESNKVYRFMVYKKLISYLSGVELDYAKSNPEDLDTIMEFIVIKFAKPNDPDFKDYRAKISSITNTEISKEKKEVLAEKVKGLYDNAVPMVKTKPIIAMLIIEKLISEIINSIKTVENLSDDTSDETVYSKNIIPKNIIISIRNVQNSLEAIQASSINQTFIDGFYETCFINLKIMSKWFLNNYLKSSNFKIESDSIYRANHCKSFKILDLYELMDLGWTIEKYMKQCMELWDEYTDFPIELSGDTMHWVNLLESNTDFPRILLDDNDNFVGFWDYIPVYDDILDRIKKGIFKETELSVDKTPIMLPGTYNIYFIGVCIKKDYRKLLAIQKILFSVLDVFEELALNGIFINEICAWPASKAGVALCKSIGLKHLLSHEEEGEIYNGTMEDILNQPLSKSYHTLKELYKENNHSITGGQND